MATIERQSFRLSGSCRSCASFCIAALLMVAGCGGGTAAWKTFHDSKAGFSADFPGNVTQPQGIEKGGAGAPQTYHFECRSSNGLTYQVTFTAQHNSSSEIAARLDSLEKQILPVDSRYTSLKTKRIALADAKGIEQVYQKDTKDAGKAFMRVRTFIVPDGDYYVTVDSETSADAYSADAERFLNSFKLDASSDKAK